MTRLEGSVAQSNLTKLIFSYTFVHFIKHHNKLGEQVVNDGLLLKQKGLFSLKGYNIPGQYCIIMN